MGGMAWYSNRPLKTTSNCVLVSKASSTYPTGKELLLQLGVGWVRMLVVLLLSSPAALPGARRVSRAKGWVGEKEIVLSGL